MQYRKLLFAIFLLCLNVTYAAAQQPAKVRKPVKNPPQYPNIIDLEGQQPQPTQQPQTQVPPPAATTPALQSEALVQAVMVLAGEVHTLVGEMRALNLRQQTQVEMARMTRLDLRVDHYERELKTVKDRLAALEMEEQNLNQLMSREGLLAQTANMATLDRDATMRQIKQQQETRLRLVLEEKERLRRVEADLTKELNAVKAVGTESEQRIKQAEELLKGISPTSPSDKP
ncbi:MAG: hypothetical protein HYR56_06055 [Acidobacteria bacterium]|nr:hypothetical protein [Acidobacteriota bacterium]MBI3421666.1 hypothetical protein [Acidobacteriota bacterium]